MTIAEIHGKIPSEFENKEDLLTSDVFGTLKNIDRKYGLMRLLFDVGINVSEEEAENAKFSFWWRFKDRTEPDVIIEGKSNLIVVEAKYQSELGADPTQLLREYQNGLKMAKEKGKSFYLVCVTEDYVEPKEIIKENKNNISNELDMSVNDIRIKWLNWQTIYNLMEDIVKEKEIDTPSKRQAEDIIELLEYKRLKYFRGFKKEEIMSIEKALGIVEKVSKGIYDLAVNLNGELEKHNIVPWEKQERIERNGASRKLSEFHDWVISYYALPYYKKDRWEKHKLYDAILFVKIFLNPFKTWVGCTLEEKREEVDTKRDNYGNFSTDILFSWLNDEDFSEAKFSEHSILKNFDKAGYLKGRSGFDSRFVLYDEISIDDLTSDETLKNLIDKLIKFEKMAPNIAEYIKTREKSD